MHALQDRTSRAPQPHRPPPSSTSSTLAGRVHHPGLRAGLPRGYRGPLCRWIPLFLSRGPGSPPQGQPQVFPAQDHPGAPQTQPHPPKPRGAAVGRGMFPKDLPRWPPPGPASLSDGARAPPSAHLQPPDPSTQTCSWSKWRGCPQGAAPGATRPGSRVTAEAERGTLGSGVQGPTLPQGLPLMSLQVLGGPSSCRQPTPHTRTPASLRPRCRSWDAPHLLLSPGGLPGLEAGAGFAGVASVLGPGAP